MFADQGYVDYVIRNPNVGGLAYQRFHAYIGRRRKVDDYRTRQRVLRQQKRGLRRWRQRFDFFVVFGTGVFFTYLLNQLQTAQLFGVGAVDVASGDHDGEDDFGTTQAVASILSTAMVMRLLVQLRHEVGTLDVEGIVFSFPAALV